MRCGDEGVDSRSRALGMSLVAVLLLTAPQGAGAAMMVHYDLTSLALVSDAVVLARRGAVRRPEPYVRIHTYTITRRLDGPLRPGQSIDISDGIYVISGDRSIYRVPEGLEDEVLLFLQRRTDETSGRTTWNITPSGMRVLYGDRVYRFEQLMNPGPFGPVPQGRDPDDVHGDQTAGGPISMAELISAVQRAITRATEVEVAAALRDPLERRRRLVALLPPRRPRVDPTEGESFSFYQDLVARRAVEVLAEAGDVDGVLEVCSRTVGFRRHLPDGIRDVLLAKATEISLAPHLRIEALLLLWRMRVPANVKSVRTVTDLMTDPDTSVRAAAAKSLERTGRVHTTAKGWKRRRLQIRAHLAEALAEAWKREPTEVVRYSILSTARVWEVHTGLRTPAKRDPWVFVARRAGPHVAYAYESLGHQPFPLGVVTVEAVSRTGTATRCAEKMIWATNKRRAFSIECPVAPGQYDLILSYEVKRGRKALSREVKLGRGKLPF